MNPIELSNVDDLDLDKHLVIEASAGTGKTYTIEHIVSNLLKQNKVTSLDQVLIVTFTDKAAGELKERIRTIIESSYQKNPGSVILRESLENFEQASIFTIHGLCNKILQQFSFENNGHFFQELVSDQMIYAKTLHDLLQNKWPLLFDKNYEPLLIISGFPDTRGDASEWENRVIKLSMKYNQHFDHIIPSVPGNMPGFATEHLAKLEAHLHSLLVLIGPINKKDIESSPLYLSYSSLNIKGNSLGAKLKTIRALLAFMLVFDEHKILNSATLTALLFFLNSTPHKNGYHTLDDHWKKEGPDYDLKLPALPEIIDLLEQVKALVVDDLQFVFLAYAIIDLNNESIIYKREHGLISYDDMISLVYESLMVPDSPLQNALRKKYSHAIVDEFQDTDMLQWHILRAVFLNKNSFESKQHLLYIIGDPKQAIYSFRGADIHAYYSAKDEMLNQHNALYYSLSHNWRSAKELIGSFNLLFGAQNWFSDDKIAYLPNSFPLQKEAQTDQGPAIVIFDLDSCNGAIAGSRMAECIALEIKHLLLDNYATADEIAILIRKWPEAFNIEKALKKHSLQYCFYKKEGLYQSSEAYHLFYVLNSLAFASDNMAFKKALLTDFFLIHPENISSYEHIPASHPVRMLFNRWGALASQHKWSEFFQSLIEDTVLLKDIIEHDNWERKLANYRQIVQHIEVTAIKNNLDLFGISNYLRDLINMVIPDDSLNIEKLETDEPKTQIMTIHASKGLEFKVVFIAGGYTKKPDEWYSVSHKNGKRIINLSSADAMVYDESGLEEERLFYVALTRAKSRLYVPRFIPAKNSKPGFVGTKLKEALSFIEKEPSCSCRYYAEIEDVSCPIFSHPSDYSLSEELFFPEILHDFSKRRLFVDSFSSIKHKKDPFQVSFDEIKYTEPDDDNSYNESITGLPHGKETGTLLHEIFEEIDFSLVGAAAGPTELLETNDFNDLISEKIETHLQLIDMTHIDSCKKESADIVWHTLNSPLWPNGPALVDCHVRIHELEFFFPAALDKLINGFIDLVFEFNNAFFVLDWKSNFLPDGYSKEDIEKNIIASRYDLQFNIYSFALIKWLKTNIPDYDFNKHFGGVYYLYIRGIHVNNPGNGVYFFKAKNEEEIVSHIKNNISFSV